MNRIITILTNLVVFLMLPLTFLTAIALAFRTRAGATNIANGLGNSGNNFYLHEPRHKLAQILLERNIAPTVSDETLKQIYDVIERQAVEGDLDAAAVIFEIAKQQNRKEE
ncbi:MAG: hypothetical protein AAF639_37815 [Chloroflexota bacterium]